MKVYIQQRRLRRALFSPLLALGLLHGLGATAQSSAETYYAGFHPAAACAEGVRDSSEASPNLLNICHDALSDAALRRPDRAATLINTGILEMRAGDSDAALALFDEAKSLGADDADIAVNVAAAQIRAGYAAEALDTLADISAVRADLQPVAYYNRGLAHWQLKDFDPAYADFKQAVALRPGYQPALDMLTYFQPVSAETGTADAARSG